VPEIVNHNMTMLIATGAAMAANCEPCLNMVVPDLIEAGVADADIRRAVAIGQTVKDKPAALMKEAADALTGTSLSQKPVSEACPAEQMKESGDYKVILLIAAGSAMAANCEPCLNKVIPDLIEAGVADADIRKAVQTGQFVKDKAAAIMKEVADALAGTNLLENPVSEGCPDVETKQEACCCG